MVLSKNELGKLVREARKIKSQKLGRKYTQVMLSKDIDKSQGYIADIELGRTYPAFKVLNRIAEACEVPFIFFSEDGRLLQQILRKDDPSMSVVERKDLADLISGYKKSYPKEMGNLDWDLEIYKEINDISKDARKDLLDALNEDTTQMQQDYLNSGLPPFPQNPDVKDLLDSVLSKPGLTLNGEILSEDSKIALSNAVQLGIQFAEQLQKKEKEKNSN